MPSWKCSNCGSQESEIENRTCKKCGETGYKYPIDINASERTRNVAYDLETEEFWEKAKVAADD